MFSSKFCSLLQTWWYGVTKIICLNFGNAISFVLISLSEYFLISDILQEVIYASNTPHWKMVGKNYAWNTQLWTHKWESYRWKVNLSHSVIFPNYLYSLPEKQTVVLFVSVSNYMNMQLNGLYKNFSSLKQIEISDTQSHIYLFSQNNLGNH